MPKPTAFVLVIFFSSVSLSAVAQNQFLVTYINGKAEKKSRKKWEELRVNDKLDMNDQVRLDRNAVMHLRDSAGKRTLFMLPGIYKIGETVTTNQSVTLQTGDGKVVFANAARVKQNFFGSNAPIKVLLPLDSTFATLYANQVVIRWFDKENKGPYHITIKSFFKEPIAIYNSDVNEFTFNLNEERFIKERLFYVTIKSKVDPRHKSAEHVFKRMISHERFRVDDILNKEIILDNSRALDQLVLAGFYEKQALFIDAINAYFEAIRLGQDDPIYSEAFAIFLQRYGWETEY